jgi:hypothetical protein
MDFVVPVAKKQPPLPRGWQQNTCEATGNAFYLHVASGRIVYKLNNMIKNYNTVAPSQAPSTALAAVELFPDNATPHHFRDGSSSAPVMLDNDEEEASKEAKESFYSAKSEEAVTGKEGFESDTENLKMSPNLLK